MLGLVALPIAEHLSYPRSRDGRPLLAIAADYQPAVDRALVNAWVVPSYGRSGLGIVLAFDARPAHPAAQLFRDWANQEMKAGRVILASPFAPAEFTSATVAQALDFCDPRRYVERQRSPAKPIESFALAYQS